MANPFTYAVEKLGPGFGGASVQVNQTAALTATATKTLTISPGCHSGRLHVGLSGPAATTTCQITVKISDGTTTSEVLPITPATAAGDSLDYLVDILSDLAVTSITITYTLAGVATTGTANLDFAGNP